MLSSLTPTQHHPITLGIFLPESCQGGTLNAAKNIAKMLCEGSRQANDPVKIIFSCVANAYDCDTEFKDLRALNIIVRETTWEIYTRPEIAHAMVYTGQSETLPYPYYTFPTDGVSNFNDCDFFLIISDRMIAPVAPFKPYALVVHDYIQRYVPEIKSPNTESYYQTFLANAREARFILTTTPGTREDAVQYAGVNTDRVLLAPMEFEPLPVQNNYQTYPGLPRPYFIWTTNLTPHKNHKRAITALDIYYSEFNGQLDTVITGHQSDLLCPIKSISHESVYIQKIQALIKKSATLKEHLHCLGNLPREQLGNLMRSAKFLWHPAIIDNGSYSVVEAAYLGVPSLSSRYPQMEFINERFQLNLSYFNPHDSEEMAKQLKNMELTYTSKQQQLPTPTFLEQFNSKQLAGAFWQLVRNLI